MIEINGNVILTPIYQILLDLQAELKYSSSHLLHTIKPPHSSSDIIVSCPVHNNGKEQHPSASITTIEKHKGDKIIPAGFMYCFSCKSKMTIDKLISYCFGKNDNGEYGRRWLLDHYVNFEIEQRDKYFNTLKEEKPKKEVRYITEEELDRYRYIHPYMYKRGLTDELIERYDIGYDSSFRLRKDSKPFECITFPIKDVYGNVLFIARRAIKRKVFHYPNDVEKPVAYLYEAQKYHGTQELYICESLFNALTLEKWGLPSVSLLGTGSKHQYNILKQLDYKKYILCFDNDYAGTNAIIKAIRAFESTQMLLIYTIKERGVDINDLANLRYEEFMKNVKVQTIGEFYGTNKSQSRSSN